MSPDVPQQINVILTERYSHDERYYLLSCVKAAVGEVLIALLTSAVQRKTEPWTCKHLTFETTVSLDGEATTQRRLPNIDVCAGRSTVRRVF